MGFLLAGRTASSAWQREAWRSVGQEVRGQCGRDKGARPWHRASETLLVLGDHGLWAGSWGSVRSVAGGRAVKRQLTLSTARILAQMKTSRGRSSRAELWSSFSTYGKMPTDKACERAERQPARDTHGKATGTDVPCCQQGASLDVLLPDSTQRVPALETRINLVPLSV